MTFGKVIVPFTLLVVDCEDADAIQITMESRNQTSSFYRRRGGNSQAQTLGKQEKHLVQTFRYLREFYGQDGQPKLCETQEEKKNWEEVTKKMSTNWEELLKAKAADKEFPDRIEKECRKFFESFLRDAAKKQWRLCEIKTENLPKLLELAKEQLREEIVQQGVQEYTPRSRRSSYRQTQRSPLQCFWDENEDYFPALFDTIDKLETVVKIQCSKDPLIAQIMWSRGLMKPFHLQETKGEWKHHEEYGELSKKSAKDLESEDMTEQILCCMKISKWHEDQYRKKKGSESLVSEISKAREIQEKRLASVSYEDKRSERILLRAQTGETGWWCMYTRVCVSGVGGTLCYKYGPYGQDWDRPELSKYFDTVCKNLK